MQEEEVHDHEELHWERCLLCTDQVVKRYRHRQAWRWGRWRRWSKKISWMRASKPLLCCSICTKLLAICKISSLRQTSWKVAAITGIFGPILDRMSDPKLCPRGYRPFPSGLLLDIYGYSPVPIETSNSTYQAVLPVWQLVFWSLVDICGTWKDGTRLSYFLSCTLHGCGTFHHCFACHWLGPQIKISTCLSSLIQNALPSTQTHHDANTVRTQCSYLFELDHERGS